MSGPDTARVHQILWDWSVLQLGTGSLKCTLYRQDMARTLYRLASTKCHVSAMLRLLRTERDGRVASTLAWACHQALVDMPLARCQQIVEAVQLDLVDVLQHPSWWSKSRGCKLVCMLAQKGRIPSSVFSRTLDSAILRMMSHVPAHDTSVRAFIFQYMMLRNIVVVEAASIGLPCGGLAWKAAVEYLAWVASRVHTGTMDAKLLAPLPSEFCIEHLVDRWSPSVQRAYVHLIATANLESLRGVYLLNVIEALDACLRVKDNVEEMVPSVLSMLEDLDHTTSSECRVQVWDAGWKLLTRVPPPALVADGSSFGRLVSLVGRVPDLTVGWSKSSIRKVFATLHTFSDALFRHVDVGDLCLVDVLPDALVHAHMDTIVSRLDERVCGVHQHFPHCQVLSRVRLLCRMTETHLFTHRVLVASHIPIVQHSIGVDQPNAILRVAAADLLHVVPETMFNACVPAMEGWILTGDVIGIMALSKLASSRLRVLRQSILHRVLAMHDTYTVGLRPSATLLLMAKLPDDVLVTVIERLVFPERFQWDGMVLHLLADPYHHVEKRLFILENMPVELLLPQHVWAISRLYLQDARLGIRESVMKIVVHTQSVAVVHHYQEWCMNQLVLDDGAISWPCKMLGMLPPSALAGLLRRHDLRYVHPLHVCKLWEYLDDPAVLSTFAEAILRVCEDHPYLMNLTMCVVAKLPWDTLWHHKERVLALLEGRIAPPLDVQIQTKHLLRLYADAGVRVACDLWLAHAYFESN